MFGQNQIVGQRHFTDSDAGHDRLLVTSIFYTLQGEGPFAGKPAIFVRLAKCNLACSFCDTYFGQGDWMTFDQIDVKINERVWRHFANAKHHSVPMWASGKRDMVLVITGGEPMLQKNIGPFLDHMSRQFEHTQIESNGILIQEIPRTTVLVVSPKCSEKDGKPNGYLKPNPDTLMRASCLKFVMCDNDPFYSEIPHWALNWKRNTHNAIYVSPMNIYNHEPQAPAAMMAEKERMTLDERSTIGEVVSFWDEGLLDMEQNRRNHEHTANYCLQHGLTFNLQMHLYAGLA